jgi:hypothetical protein
MLTMRQEQVEAFRQHHLQKFEDEMVEHLKKTQVEHWKVMGEANGRKVIRLGIEQAAKYGFTRRGPVRFYIDLMFTFGSFFDTDPQYPWASTALANPEGFDEAVIADRLFNAMSDYYVTIVDPEREHLRAAVQELMKNHIEDVLQPGVNLEELILNTLRSVCPIRCDYSGEAVLHSLIQRGFELAQHYDLATDKGKVLMATLTFAVGHGFYKDPLNGWIVRRLENKRWSDPNKRVDDLSSKSMIYLKHILAARSQA